MIPARFDNIFTLKKKKHVSYYTKSLFPSFRGFEETIIRRDGVTYREVNPERSKLFAGIAKGVSQIGMREGSNVLYLGASHGYTPSYVSDIIGKSGQVLCIDVAPRVVRDLYFLCEKRDNMAPLLKNCRDPDSYKEFVPNKVDVVFQDIAQKDQVSIFLKNCRAYLKQDGFGVLAIKARSIDVTKKPAIIFKQAFLELEATKGFVIVDKKELAPFEQDHILFVVKKK